MSRAAWAAEASGATVTAGRVASVPAVMNTASLPTASARSRAESSAHGAAGRPSAAGRASTTTECVRCWSMSSATSRSGVRRLHPTTWWCIRSATVAHGMTGGGGGAKLEDGTVRLLGGSRRTVGATAAAAIRSPHGWASAEAPLVGAAAGLLGRPHGPRPRGPSLRRALQDRPQMGARVTATPGGAR